MAWMLRWRARYATLRYALVTTCMHFVPHGTCSAEARGAYVEEYVVGGQVYDTSLLALATFVDLLLYTCLSWELLALWPALRLRVVAVVRVQPLPSCRVVEPARERQNSTEMTRNHASGGGVAYRSGIAGLSLSAGGAPAGGRLAGPCRLPEQTDRQTAKARAAQVSSLLVLFGAR